MKWEEFSSWLKWGFIFGMIGITSSIICLLGLIFFIGAPEWIAFVFAPFIIISLPGLVLSLFLGLIRICLPFTGSCPTPSINPYLGFIMAGFINFIFYFIIGAIIGLVYNKLKNLKDGRN